MKTYAMALDLIDDENIIFEYEEYHQNVWPEVLESIKELGINRMRIFRISNRMFMLIEANDSYDPNNLMNYSNTNEKADEWNNIMMKFQQKVPGSLPNEWWASMKQVFDSEISSN
jgi:L-rhamnose mutarotase|tara:strand:+ start:238 stop:582 length:345 start_codon:yes stop_codon:yes gene_type:complete